MLIRGVDYAPYTEISSVSANNNVIMNQDNMSFTIVLDGELPAPRAGMEVVWQRWNPTTQTEISREFAGVLTSVREEVEGTGFIYDCQADSYLRWFNRRIVNGFFQQQLAETTIRQVVSRYCPGFTTNSVVAPLSVVPQYAEYRRPFDFIKGIVDQIGYGFYIDYYRDVHVYRIEDHVSPLPQNLLNIDTDFVNYGDLILEENAENVYNRFTIRGFKQRAKTPYTLRFLGDGVTTQWNLGYRFSSAKGDSVVKIDGKNYPVVRDILDGLPGQANDPRNAYVHWTQHQMRFAHPPAPGAIIEFTGYPLVNKTRIDQDDASIEYMRLLEDTPASDGIYEWAEVDKSLSQSTQDAITAKIQLLALKYGLPTIAGSFSSFTPGWRAGQMFRMTSARRMGGAITAEKRFYAYRVSKKWIQPHHDGTSKIQYTIEFADKPYLV